MSHHRHAQTHSRAAPRTAHHLHHSFISIEHLHALAHVAQTDARTLAHQPAHRLRHRSAGLHADTIIFYFNYQAFALQAAAYRHGASADARLQTVLDAVFNQRLQQHTRHDKLQRVLGDVFHDSQFFAEAHHLDVHVVVRERKLLTQRHKRFTLPQQCAKNVAELDDQFARELRP